ncbi:MAG: sigma-70 family RNA polymerase sigma factor [Myxococcota bacterium]
MPDEPPHSQRSSRLNSATARARAFANAAAEADNTPFEQGLGQEAILERYNGIVVQLVRNLRRSWSIPKSETEDMMSNGRLGLLEAYARFDPTHGSSFSTFAYYRVKGSIVDGLRNAGVLRRRKELRRRLSDAMDAVSEDMRTAKPTSADLKTNIEHVDQMVRNMGTVWLIIQDAALRAAEAGDRRMPGRRLLEAEMRQQLHNAIDQLTDVEQAVIRGHHFEGQSLAELARAHGYSRSWMCRVHQRALDQLAQLMGPNAS